MTATRTFRLVAEVSSDDPSRLRAVLEEFIGGPVLPEPRGYSARDLNRQLLTALRRVERRTRLRSAWTADGVTERFFDYASRGSRPAD
jgi:hypothetical protein